MNKNILLLLLISALLAACGNSKSSNMNAQEQASLEIPNEEEILTDGKVFSYCNLSSSDEGGFKLALHSYVENGKPVNEMMYAMITQVPAGFKTANEPIRFFRWKVNSSGNAVVDSKPLAFQLVDPAKGDVILSSRSSFKWSDVKEAASAMYTSTPKDFFRRAHFVLNLDDVTAEYQGVVMASYQSDGTTSDQVKALLPLFNIDPTGYANPSAGVTRPTVLTNLHPYKSDEGKTLSIETNQARVASLCAPWNE